MHPNVHSSTALFIIAKIWEQRKCSSTDEWINKMFYVHTHTHTHTHTHQKMGYYSAIKKNEIIHFQQQGWA